MRLTSRSKLLLCVLIAVAAVLGSLVVPALILRPSGIWVVWTALQVPISALFGVLAWLGWFAIHRGLEPQRSRGTDALAAGVGAAILCLVLVAYWFDTSLGLHTVIQAIVLPLATIATFVTLRDARGITAFGTESERGLRSTRIGAGNAEGRGREIGDDVR